MSAAALTGDALPQSLSADDLAGVCSANDTLVRVTVTGAELKAYLEWAAACYNQWKSGDIGISFQPERPAHTRDVFAGVDYELDLSKPAGERVQNVRFRGAPLSDDQQLKLVVSSERYAVQLKGQSLISGEYDWSSRQTLGALISDYLTGHAAPAAADGNWSITGVDLSLDSAERATLVALIRSGQLETPYAKSLNLNHYEVKNLLASANNVKLSDLDQFGTAASFADADGVPTSACGTWPSSLPAPRTSSTCAGTARWWCSGARPMTAAYSPCPGASPPLPPPYRPQRSRSAWTAPMCAYPLSRWTGTTT